MTKKEYYALCNVHEALFMIVHYHNKNLTKSQYYDLEDSLDTIDKLIKDFSNKRLLGMIDDLGKGKSCEEIIKKEFDL